MRNGFLTTFFLLFWCLAALAVGRVVFFKKIELDVSPISLALNNFKSILEQNKNILSGYQVQGVIENHLPVSTYAFDSKEYFSVATEQTLTQEVSFKDAGVKKIEVADVTIEHEIIVDNVSVAKIKKTDRLEIRSNELIKHYGFSVELPSAVNWVAMLEQTKIEGDKNFEQYLAQQSKSVIELPEQKVVVEQKIEPSTNDIIKPNLEDVVASLSLVDHQEDSDQLDTRFESPTEEIKAEEEVAEIESIAQQANLPVSGRVGKAIERAIEDRVTSGLSTGTNVPRNYGHSLTTQPVSSQLVASAMLRSSAECASQTLLTASSIDIATSSSNKVYNFEFIPEFDKYEGLQDIDGRIELCRTLNNSMSILSGVVAKEGKMRTRIDLIIEEGRIEFNVPLFDRESFYALLAENDLAYGAQDKANILLELDSSILDFELDSLKGEKFYFSDDFKVLEEGDADIRYVLIAGLPPGNTFLRYRTKKNLHAEKVIHIAQDEIYYESSALYEPQTDDFQLMEKNLLSSVESELSIDEEKLLYFNTAVHATKVATNLYKIRRPLLPYGTRKYLELRHMAGAVYVGYWDQKILSIPAPEFINHIFDVYGLSSLQDRCLVQINISKMMADFSISGFNGRMESNLDVIFLDEDGTIGREITSQTKKIFVLGEEQGILNARVKYADDSVDYLQSYCSKNDYIIEQL